MGRSFNPAGGGVTPFDGQEILQAFTCSPLTVSVNDFMQPGRQFLNASLINVSATAVVNMTGMVGATLNREATLLNTGADAITLLHASGASLARNRFAFPADVILGQNQSVNLVGLGANGWALKGGAPASGGGSAPASATYVTLTDESVPLPDSALLGPGTFSGASVYGGSTIQIASATLTPVPNLSVVEFDEDKGAAGAYWNIAQPQRFTIPADGYYLVTGAAAWSPGVICDRLANLWFKNGDTSKIYGYAAGNSVGSGNDQMGITSTFIEHFAAGDTIDFYVEANITSGAFTIGIVGDPNNRFTYMAITQLH